MTDTPVLRRFQFDVWANARILVALQSANPSVPAGEHLFAHIHQAQRIWLGRILGNDSTQKFDRFPSLTLTEAIALRDDITKELHAYIATLCQEADLARVVRFNDLSGNPQADRLADILDQLFVHGAYHRAQIATLLRQAGITPPNTDYIAYVRSLK
ncbi:DinB family protein [Candidatus Sumerlaeota bacterium]|nr:DinB family protein [Candidatus Sumerlaeota bacterium]